MDHLKVILGRSSSSADRLYIKQKKSVTCISPCNLKTINLFQGCALAEPGGPWRLTFALGRLENLRFFIQIICWAPWILQFQSTGLPSI